MKRFGGKRSIWFFPITTSLLLHIPVIFLLSYMPLPKPDVTPSLKLSARSLPAKIQPEPQPGQRQAVQTQPPAQQPRQRTETPKAPPQTKPRPKTKPENTPKTEPGAPEKNLDNTVPTPGPPANVSPAPDNGGAGEAAGPSQPQQPQGGAAAQSGPVDVYSLQITKKIIPDYPAFSRKRNESGTVKIIVTIKGGSVVKAAIRESSGYERLDNSALRAAKQWRFNYDGETQAIIPFIFNLSD